MSTNGYPDDEGWKECGVCKGHGSVYGHYYTTDPQTGGMVLRCGYIDCTNPVCMCGYIYVPEKAELYRKISEEEKLEELNAQPPVTLGDVFSDAFQQIREAMKNGHMKRI